jgi:hypothetical protein
LKTRPTNNTRGLILKNKELYLKSSIFGAVAGMGFGILIGALTGTLTPVGAGYDWHNG